MDINQVKKDIDGAKIVGENRYNPIKGKNCFNKYGKVYSFNNEQVNKYYKYFNYEGPILTVASSGDHMLHSILAGASDITLFDINRLTKYYCMLKLAGIKTLSYKEFLTYFMVCPMVNLKIEKLYKKVRDALSDEDRYFWDEIIKDGSTEYNFYDTYYDIIRVNNSYYDEDVYYDLQNKALQFDEPKFLETDIFALPNRIERGKKFSSIFLSNIYDYVDNIKFKDLLNNLIENYVQENGLIQTASLMDYSDIRLDMESISDRKTLVIKKW